MFFYDFPSFSSLLLYTDTVSCKGRRTDDILVADPRKMIVFDRERVVRMAAACPSMTHAVQKSGAEADCKNYLTLFTLLP